MTKFAILNQNGTFKKGTILKKCNENDYWSTLTGVIIKSNNLKVIEINRYNHE